MTTQTLKRFTIGAAFSLSKPVEIFASYWLDAIDEANLKHSDLRSPGEPWKISQVLEWSTDGSCELPRVRQGS
jgi:hypothetical protein